MDQKIIEREASLAEHRFIRRFTLLWLLVGNPLAISALVLINTLVDWTNDTGGNRGFTNVVVGVATLASVLGSIYWWNIFRTKISEVEVELRQLELERRHLQAQGTGATSVSGAFPEYYESIPVIRDEFRRSAERYRSRHNLFQLTVIIGSILTSVSTTAAAEQGIWSWIAVGLSALVSMSAGIIAYFKFRERSLNLQQTADSIDLELQAFALKIRRYRGLGDDQATATFAEEVERIREEQRKKELQLEQPPEATPQQRPQTA
ncbi:DUF4231 domain-containing protein [Streptomyces sp. NPDC006553]|uniref:DUF4231 domain-containing protein n=1 Tax=Streptomyces sp. NPDC006553 TaxID=3157180 RepID=UPI0033A6512B